MKKIVFGLMATAIMASFSTYANNGRNGKSKKCAKTECCKKTKCQAPPCDKKTCPMKPGCEM